MRGRPTGPRWPGEGRCWPATRTCRRRSRRSGTRPALSAPGFDAAGVSVPGLPGILIGHNARIAWSLTDTQNQATLFYAENISLARASTTGTAAWRPMPVVHYTIPVRGARDQPAHRGHHRARADHDPGRADHLGRLDGQRALTRPGGDARRLDQAASFSQFKAALAGWYAPTQNFVDADYSREHRRDLGRATTLEVGAGCQPWLPMTGHRRLPTSPALSRTRPKPQVYDPPSHVLVHREPAAGHRRLPVLHRDYGRLLRPRLPHGHHQRRPEQPGGPLAPARFAAVQTNPTDQLAARMVPELLTAVRGTALSSPNDPRYLSCPPPGPPRWGRGWPPRSGGPSGGDYLSAVFQPWWNQAKVPVAKDHEGLAVSVDQASLDEDLEAWTLGDPANPAFALPSGAADRSSGHAAGLRHGRGAPVVRPSAVRRRSGPGGGCTRARSDSLSGTNGLGMPSPAAVTRSRRTPPTAG